VRIPLTRYEYFLLEYRTRSSSFYERNLPAEGVLVWHVREIRTGPGAGRTVVDLECADGRYLDAGYPVGTVIDPRNGGDNLDFWAHDQAYAATFAGNLGDATDPFDGVRAHAFTPDTNPDSYDSSRQLSIRLEDNTPGRRGRLRRGVPAAAGHRGDRSVATWRPVGQLPLSR
jgi:hypothetical protein